MRVLMSALVGVATVQAANPIRRVVTLLQDMQKEIEDEGEKEKDNYEKFNCYCKGNTDGLSKQADEAASAIEELGAKVKQEKAEKAQTEGELRQAKEDRTNAKNDLAKATAIRKKENATYVKDSGDTKDNIDATNGAIKALEKGSAAFLQSTSANKLKSFMASGSAPFEDDNDREIVTAFLSGTATGDYAPQSGQIIGILKNMKDEMDKSLGGIVSDEESSAAGFKDLKAAKQKEIQAASTSIENKTQRVGELAVSIVQNQNAQDDATKSLDDAQKFLANLKVMCKEKAADWEVRQQTRAEEVAAIGEAISVLNDDDALDTFNATLKKPAPAGGAAFLQRATNPPADVAKKVAKVLKDNQKVLAKNSSPALNLLVSTLSAKLQSGVDFSTVIKMIDDMVALLKKEQVDDEKHKNFCDAEFDSSADEQKATEQKIEGLVSSLSEMNDEIASLSDRINTAHADIADLDKSVAEATAQRKAEHKDFTNSQQLNDAATQLIFKAKNRLNKFYNPDMYQAPAQRGQTATDRATEAAGGSVDYTAFIQLRASQPGPPPETFGDSYQSKGQKSNGIIALMDRLANDLENDNKEGQHTEKTAQKEYAELVADAQESKAQQGKNITSFEGSKAELEGKVQDAKSQKVIADDALNTTKGYIADLHSSCDFISANFEIRREARTQEMSGLQNAKAVLNGANFK